MKKQLLLTFTLATLATLLIPLALAQTATLYEHYNTGYDSQVNVHPAIPVAQTFTPSESHYINYVSAR